MFSEYSVLAGILVITWWGWLLIVLLLVALLALLIVWWLWRSKRKAIPPAAVEEVAPPAVIAKPTASTPDDLERIEGIGPKIAEVLQAAGITTFAQLAATEMSRLEQVLREAGIKLADPTTWPEQAGLAAAGKWDQLESLQKGLKGGRRLS